MNREILEKIVKESKTISEVIRKLGLRVAGGNFKSIKNRIKKFDIDTSHFDANFVRNEKLKSHTELFIKRKLVDCLVENSDYNNRSSIKKRLFEEGLKINKCELCGQDENWYGKKMTLILDHINGVWNDNRIENLRIVCPNCNATLDTHCGKQKSKQKKEEYKKTITQNKINLYLSKRKVDRPEYEVLLKEVDELGYSATGRKYGVSDNSIRKWLNFYQKRLQ